MRSTSATAFVLAVVTGLSTSFAQEADPSRVDRLEKELETTKERLQELERKQAAGGESKPAKSTAAAQGEKFQKKFGTDAMPVWNNGFSLLRLDDGSGLLGFLDERPPEERVIHRLSLNGRVQADYRVYADEDHPQRDRFFLRRSRINLNGTFWRYHDFMVEFDLAQFNATPFDVWYQLSYLKGLQFRIGHFKPPSSLENTTSSRYLNFVERHMFFRALNLNYDMGAGIHGELGWLQYQVMAHNGMPNNTADSNEEKDVTARLAFVPFNGGNGPIQHLWIGAHFGYGHQDNFIPTYQTTLVTGGTNPSTAAASSFLTFPTGTTQQGGRRHYGLEARLNIPPILIEADYGNMMVEDLTSSKAAKVDLTTRGARVDLLVMLTGEPHPWSKRIIPKRNFNPFEGGLGAWELGVRWDHITVEDDAREDLGATGADEVNSLVAGLNWYLSPHFKFQGEYVRSWFNRDAAHTGRDTEDAIALRFAMEF